MPAQSALTSDEKAKVKSAVITSLNKIHSAAVARVYYAYPEPTKWAWAGLQGAVVFSQNLSTGVFSFKVVDLEGTRGVCWEHELYQDFEYYVDRPFFHSFAGDVSVQTVSESIRKLNFLLLQKCMIGIVFADEKEAKHLYKRVVGRKTPKNSASISAYIWHSNI